MAGTALVRTRARPAIRIPVRMTARAIRAPTAAPAREGAAGVVVEAAPARTSRIASDPEVGSCSSTCGGRNAMRYVRAVVLITIGALAAMGINAADAGPNGGGATGSRVTQVKTQYSEVSVGTIVVQHAAAGDPTTYFAINAWHVIAERIAA